MRVRRHSKLSMSCAQPRARDEKFTPLKSPVRPAVSLSARGAGAAQRFVSRAFRRAASARALVQICEKKCSFSQIAGYSGLRITVGLRPALARAAPRSVLTYGLDTGFSNLMIENRYGIADIDSGYVSGPRRGGRPWRVLPAAPAAAPPPLVSSWAHSGVPSQRRALYSNHGLAFRSRVRLDAPARRREALQVGY